MISIIDTLLKEEKKLLNEIGEGNATPFPWNKEFYYGVDEGDSCYTMFYAPLTDKPLEEKDIPLITIMFNNYENDKYEVGFNVNGDDEQFIKTNIKYYLKIMSTLFNILKLFIEQNKPQTLKIKGIDKSDVYTPGQKNRIYFSYIEKNADSLGYKYGHKNNGLILIKK